MTIASDAITKAQTEAQNSTDPLCLIDVDHVRFHVGNAKQAAHFYAACFGFQVDQRRDQTTGSRDEATYLLRQGNIRYLISTGLTPDHPAQEDVRKYGDGIADVAFNVADAEAAYRQAIKNGGQSAYEPRTVSDERGSITMAGIKSYGRVVHSFVSRTGRYALQNIRDDDAAPFMPGFEQMDFMLNQYNKDNPCGLKFVDHCVGNVEEGKMNEWVQWYENVMGFKLFKHFDDNDISTEYSALMSKVMASGFGVIKMPLNEPADGKKKSQILEYLEWHNMTPGVQHLALRTDDALESVAELRKRGVDFLRLPDTYYENVWERVEGEMGADVTEDHKRIQDLGILVDADEDGYLLQLFTKPLQDRPTLFFEIITRRGSESFGKGNFKALFEALEIEQDRRGNL